MVWGRIPHGVHVLCALAAASADPASSRAFAYPLPLLCPPQACRHRVWSASAGAPPPHSDPAGGRSDNALSGCTKWCAALCQASGIPVADCVAGETAGSQCACGTLNATALPDAMLPPSRCRQKCSGNASEVCGGDCALQAHRIACQLRSGPAPWFVPPPPAPGPPKPPPPPTPPPPRNGWGACAPGSVSAGLKFCDPNTPLPERVADFVSRLTTEEKVARLTDMQPANTRLGIPAYSWNTEGLHGLGAACLDSGRCPTIFPAPPGMGAAFNRTVWRAAGDVIGNEARAYNNHGQHRVWSKRPIGINIWVPNLNMPVDPRGGRNKEMPSEDPYHSGQYGTALVQGIQGADVDPPWIKMAAALKHFAVYNRETNRMLADFNVSAHDLSDTFFPGFREAVVSGGALGYMCSYTSVNGVPSCGSPYLETELMRGEWGLGNGSVGGSYIVSDCGAVQHIADKHFNSSRAAATAQALNAGTDVVCNEDGIGARYAPSILAALATNLTTQAALDASLARSAMLQFRAGLFERDPLSGPFGNLTLDVVGSTEHAQLALEAAEQSLVLLKNRGGVLPFKPGRRVVVIGPVANSSTALTGSYFEAVGPVPTLFEAVEAENVGGTTTYVAGVPTVKSSNTSGVAAAAQAATEADLVVLAVGIDGTVCGESVDRSDIGLPAGQLALLNATLAAAAARGVPAVTVLVNGGVLSVPAADALAPAVIEAFFPGQSGGFSVARAIFGTWPRQRWGKLPYTVYQPDYVNQATFGSMNMTAPPGRGYRYFTGTPLYTFGYGLSYTTFSISPASGGGPGDAAPALTLDTRGGGRSGSGGSSGPPPPALKVKVTNTGATAGDEVVFAFLTKGCTSLPPPPDALAMKQLFGFERVTLGPGESTVVTFEVTVRAAAETRGDGARVATACARRYVDVTRGHGEVVRFPVAVTGPDAVVDPPVRL